MNYSHVTDVFTHQTLPITEAFITKKDLATQDITSLNISYPFQYKWYSVFGNLNAYYSKFKADFGAGERLTSMYMRLHSTHKIHSVSKGLTEVSGWYASPSIWQVRSKQTNMGLMAYSENHTERKSNIKASVSGIFNTLH